MLHLSQNNVWKDLVKKGSLEQQAFFWASYIDTALHCTQKIRPLNPSMAVEEYKSKIKNNKLREVHKKKKNKYHTH